MNAGVQFQGSELYKLSSEPKTMYSAKFPVWNGCIAIFPAGSTTPAVKALATEDLWQIANGGDVEEFVQEDRLLAVTGGNDGSIPGTTWAGTIEVVGVKPECQQYNSGTLSLQLVYWDSASNFELIGASVFTAGDLDLGTGRTCVVQTGYVGYVLGDCAVFIKPSGNETSAPDYELEQCTSDEAVLPYGWEGFASKDMETITGTDADRCTQITLSRAGGASGGKLIADSLDDTPDQVAADCEGESAAGERACLLTDGCGWCVDANSNSGCCSPTVLAGEACAPWGNAGQPLSDACSKGWQPANPEGCSSIGNARAARA
eukprot:jgi/Tetstr1/456159/TSEL_042927.t1